MSSEDTPVTPERSSPQERFQSPNPAQHLLRALSSPSLLTMTVAETTSSPTGPSASCTNISPEQLANLLSKVVQNHGPAPGLLSKPRIGGKSPAGVWTGFGAGCTLKVPPA